ncbi:hypothetical protein HOP54_20575 [Halomonas daqingensis]|uniref:hypothetical protein n=1 Tax=Billgrantia desiderata TaxID=52021 RepID=UPI001F2438B0|nr:hypothetical protein [Halomonas desiderata]MCE8031088.1 hypothetical protein [Halomonas desiderata]
MRKARKALTDNPMLVVTVLLIVGALLEYVLHEPRLAMSPGMATFLGLALISYLLHEGYLPNEVRVPGLGFSISVKSGPGSARTKRRETVRDEVFGLDLAGDAQESGSNDDGYWYRFKSGLQVARSHVVLREAREWVEFPRPYSSRPTVVVNGADFERGSITCEGFTMCRLGKAEDAQEAYYLALGECGEN